jgi:hypothetical protein
MEEGSASFFKKEAKNFWLLGVVGRQWLWPVAVAVGPAKMDCRARFAGSQ